MGEVVIRPLHDRIIVRMDECASVTSGGILLTEDSADVPNTATVVAVGNLVNREGSDLKPGDRVMLMERCGFNVKDGTTIITCNDVIGVIGESSFKPMHERVLVLMDDVNDVTAGGIILPEDGVDIVNTGTVKAYGSLVNKQGEDIEVGDTVMVTKYAGLNVNVGGVDHKLLLCNDMIGVIEQ
jgi:chaperonin GroES